MRSSVHVAEDGHGFRDQIAVLRASLLRSGVGGGGGGDGSSGAGQGETGAKEGVGGTIRVTTAPVAATATEEGAGPNPPDGSEYEGENEFEADTEAGSMQRDPVAPSRPSEGVAAVVSLGATREMARSGRDEEGAEEVGSEDDDDEGERVRRRLPRRQGSGSRSRPLSARSRDSATSAASRARRQVTFVDRERPADEDEVPEEL